jgi:HD superfamily phosphodiesterase
MNIAKVDLSVTNCRECPFCHKPKGCAEYYCRHDLKHPGVDVGEGKKVPDFCPFVLGRLQKALRAMDSVSNCAIPKKNVCEIEKKQKDSPDTKFDADHGRGHINRVTDIGLSIFKKCAIWGFFSPDSIQKEQLLFEIAASLHDIGLADSSSNHATHSAEVAKRFLTGPKIDLDEEDVEVIIHAIRNHSKGEEIKSGTDAILLLADKLDVTKERIIRVRSKIAAELSKVYSVSYNFHGRAGRRPSRAELRYVTKDDFDIEALLDWPKIVTIPMRVTKEFFKVPEFRFIVNEEVIDLSKIIT